MTGSDAKPTSCTNSEPPEPTAFLRHVRVSEPALAESEKMRSSLFGAVVDCRDLVARVEVALVEIAHDTEHGTWRENWEWPWPSQRPLTKAGPRPPQSATEHSKAILICSSALSTHNEAIKCAALASADART